MEAWEAMSTIDMFTYALIGFVVLVGVFLAGFSFAVMLINKAVKREL